MAMWWIVGIVLTTFYTANLTASLARPVSDFSLQHPRKLAVPENKNIRWLALHADSLHSLIRTEAGDFHAVLNNDLETGRGELVDSISDARDLVETKGISTIKIQ